jgi:hypothetical protein
MLALHRGEVLGRVDRWAHRHRTVVAVQSEGAELFIGVRRRHLFDGASSSLPSLNFECGEVERLWRGDHS